MINTLNAYDNAWASISEPEKTGQDHDAQGISREEILEAVIGTIGTVNYITTTDVVLKIK